ncbi:hypothetical protein E2C01_039626 [Portunus trituberculatus]|uniref:Uncharacterized protein n=1 Tax=Portunus trituberculatus TaxID=210409 RepID=A0A5B7FE41_PORTR|nr:hypothetical protein [Portunus trituberculatus]
MFAAVAVATACLLEAEGGIIVDLHMVEEEACDDEDYILLHGHVAASDWTAHKDEELLPLHPYYWMRQHLSCCGDIIMYTTDEGHLHVVVPTGLLCVVLFNLHSGHQGKNSMMCQFRHSMY